MSSNVGFSSWKKSGLGFQVALKALQSFELLPIWAGLEASDLWTFHRRQRPLSK